MIKYYAYYNHGGYKDFFLGSNEDTITSRYFLPLLSFFESDESMTEKVAEWKKLPPIIFLSQETKEVKYPSEARVMMTHAGYKLQYRHIEDKDVFAIRDISGHKDADGRACPFVMMMVADSDLDKQCLKKVCYYAWNNLEKFESLLNRMFVNDFDVNGLRFEIGELNTCIANIVDSTIEILEENSFNKSVHLFVFPDSIPFATAISEQKITKAEIAVAYAFDGNTNREIYRFTTPQMIYGPSCSIPIYQQPNRDSPTWGKESSLPHGSIRQALGIVKAEDFDSLLKSHQNLLMRVVELENKIKEIENKNH